MREAAALGAPGGPHAARALQPPGRARRRCCMLSRCPARVSCPLMNVPPVSWPRPWQVLDARAHHRRAHRLHSGLPPGLHLGPEEAQLPDPLSLRPHALDGRAGFAAAAGGVQPLLGSGLPVVNPRRSLLGPFAVPLVPGDPLHTIPFSFSSTRKHCARFAPPVLAPCTTRPRLSRQPCRAANNFALGPWCQPACVSARFLPLASRLLQARCHVSPIWRHSCCSGVCRCALASSQAVHPMNAASSLPAPIPCHAFP